MQYKNTNLPLLPLLLFLPLPFPTLASSLHSYSPILLLTLYYLRFTSTPLYPLLLLRFPLYPVLHHPFVTNLHVIERDADAVVVVEYVRVESRQARVPLAEVREYCEPRGHPPAHVDGLRRGRVHLHARLVCQLVLHCRLVDQQGRVFTLKLKINFHSWESPDAWDMSLRDATFVSGNTVISSWRLLVLQWWGQRLGIEGVNVDPTRKLIFPSRLRQPREF